MIGFSPANSVFIYSHKMRIQFKHIQGGTYNDQKLYVTVFWKTDHLDTRTEIHLLPVRDRHTHALSRNTKH